MHSEKRQHRRSRSAPRFNIPEALESVFDTGDGMFATDMDGRILFWNRAAGEILGFQKEEVVGKLCYQVFPSRDQAGNLFCFKGCSVLTMAQQRQSIRNFNTEAITKTHQKIWLNTSILLVSGKRQDSFVVVHLFRPTSLPGQKDASDGSASANTREWLSLLTPREREVLSLLIQCLGAKEIAIRLGISTETARTHIQNVLKKLKVHSSLEAVIKATERSSLSKANARFDPLL